MLQGIINNAISAAGALVAKKCRARVGGGPFIIALGFATTAGTLMLIERFGHRDAYLMVAGGFTVIGPLATLAVRTKEQHELTASEQAARTESAGVAAAAGAAAAVQMPLALLGGLFSSPIGPSTLLSLVRLIGRNLPMALVLGAIGMLFWSKFEDATSTEPEEITPQPKSFTSSRAPRGSARLTRSADAHDTTHRSPNRTGRDPQPENGAFGARLRAGQHDKVLRMA